MSGNEPILAHASDASPPPTPLNDSYLLPEAEIRALLDPRTFKIYREARVCREHDRYAPPGTRTIVRMILDRLDIQDQYGSDAELIRLQLENYMSSDEAIWHSTVPRKVRWMQLKAYVEHASYSDKFLDKLLTQFHDPDWTEPLGMSEFARDALMMYLERDQIWYAISEKKRMSTITEILNCYVTKTNLHNSTKEGYVYAEKLLYAHRDDLVCKIMAPAIACARSLRYGEMVFDRTSDDDDYDYDDNYPTSRSRSPSRSPSRTPLWSGSPFRSRSRSP